MEYITLLKSDPKIKTYLSGVFSDTKVALPVPPLSGRVPEGTTFKILESKNIDKPNFIIIISKIIRIELLGLTMFPFIVSMLYFSAMGHAAPKFELFVSLCSMFFLHASVFMLNDYFDHTRGGDRISSTSGSQVIQLGWIPAYKVLRGVYLSSLMALFFALPLLKSHFFQLWPLALFVFVAIVGFSFFGKGFKNKGLGEFFVFMCLGPLVFFGTSTLFSVSMDFNSIYLSITFGWASVFYQQLKNFSNIYSDTQLSVGTLVSRWGFDASKKLLYVQFFLVLFLIFGGSFLTMPLFFAAPWILFLSTYGFKIYKCLRCVGSPLSSQMVRLPKLGLKLHSLMSYGLIAYLLIFIFLGRQ